MNDIEPGIKEALGDDSKPRKKLNGKDGGSPENHFITELTALLNKYSKENDSHTPDFVLAEYIGSSLAAFNYAVRYRESIKEINQPKGE